LAELFQWIGDDDNKDIGSCFTMETLDKIGQEMADVSIYLIRLCDVCNVKLGEVVLNVLDEKRNY
jgi:NTP pyrophosphatase (non-canonical NTP hydrolase)